MHITKFNTWVTNGRENIVFKRFVLKLTILRHVLFTSILRARSCGDDLIDKRMRVEKLITTCVVWQCKCKTRARRHAECVIERAGGLSGKNTNESEDRGVPHQRVAAAAARSSRKSAQRYAAVTPTHPRPLVISARRTSWMRCRRVSEPKVRADSPDLNRAGDLKLCADIVCHKNANVKKIWLLCEAISIHPCHGPAQHQRKRKQCR